MIALRLLLIWSISSFAYASGGFEKSTLWSARAAQHGGAYASSVQGGEALFFNPASLRSEANKEFNFGIGASSGSLEGPIIKSDEEVKSFSGPVTPMGAMFAQNITKKDAIGFGVYSVGGLSTAFNDVNLSSLGSEFNSFRPDAYGRLSVLELGLGYSRNLSSNFSLGGTLRSHFANGGFSQIQVVEARGLSGMGIPDGTILAVSNGEFEDLKGYSSGSYTLGANYLTTNKDLGISIVYRSQVNISLTGKGTGKVVYSNTGALASGATAGQIYSLSGNQSTIASSLPEAWTISFFKRFGMSNKFHFEYTWAEYSHNEQLKIDGELTNPVDNTTTKIPDVNLKWHDMHEFKFGWTNSSFENWLIGGGYSLTLPVTNKKAAGATFAAPANYHNFYIGAGRRFERFRIDGAYEYYFSSGSGKTDGTSSGNQASPPIKGDFKSRCYSFIASLTYFM